VAAIAAAVKQEAAIPVLVGWGIAGQVIVVVAEQAAEPRLES
jgi:uncharacterized membrane protein YjfL (UPF0719 family)